MAPDTETRPDSDGRPELGADDDTPRVNARCVSEERTVFTEDGNPDGWIATELTVSSRR